MSGTFTDGDERNDADWVRESVIKRARETGDTVGSGAWLASPVEGHDRIDVYRFDHSVATETDQEDEDPRSESWDALPDSMKEHDNMGIDT